MKPSPRKPAKDIVAVVTGTIYLFTYCILLQYPATKPAALIMLGLAPFMLVAMVYVVLRHGHYNGPSLGDEEFGYQDKNKNDLGMF